jgi:hypothetical protein
VLVLTVDDQASFREVARRVVEVVLGFRWSAKPARARRRSPVRHQTPDRSWT